MKPYDFSCLKLTEITVAFNSNLSTRSPTRSSERITSDWTRIQESRQLHPGETARLSVICDLSCLIHYDQRAWLTPVLVQWSTAAFYQTPYSFREQQGTWRQADRLPLSLGPLSGVPREQRGTSARGGRRAKNLPEPSSISMAASLSRFYY